MNKYWKQNVFPRRYQYEFENFMFIDYTYW